MPATSIFHVGVLVDDIEAAKQRFGELLRLTFVETETLELEFGPDGASQLRPVTFSFSVEGPPFIELIQTTDDGPFARDQGEGLHHLASWAPDVTQRLNDMSALGAEAELLIVGPGDPCPLAAYVEPRTIHGVRLELVVRRPDIPGYTELLPGTTHP